MLIVLVSNLVIRDEILMPCSKWSCLSLKRLLYSMIHSYYTIGRRNKMYNRVSVPEPINTYCRLLSDLLDAAHFPGCVASVGIG